MTSYRRMRLPGATYFFTVCLEDRASMALTDHIDLLRLAYATTVREMPVTCHAMVVLPDHLHAIWTLPEGDAEFSERWRRIKARFTRYVGFSGARCDSKIVKRERGLWQRRFWEHVVRDEDSLGSAITYCWNNPVKHGLVSDPADWVFSSFHRQMRRDGQNCPSYAAMLGNTDGRNRPSYVTSAIS
ncbi:MAG: REP-associated tyrosine transposase [Paracoccaceae bacterium]